MNYTTTLDAIWHAGPCEDGWNVLLDYLGKTVPNDDPLPLSLILDSNGLSDALWCLRVCRDAGRDARLFAVWCARQVPPPINNVITAKLLDVAEGLAYGKTTEAERCAALAAARGSSYSALGRDAAFAAIITAKQAQEEIGWLASNGLSDATSRLIAAADARRKAKAAQTEKFREMFCIDEPNPEQETPE